MRALATALFCLTAAVSAFAQDPVAPSAATDAPAHLAFVEGGVDLIHEGVAERADPPVLLVEGDILRTANGRAEIVFGDGTLLHLDHSAELEMLGPERMRLVEGRAILRLSAAVREPYTIDTPGGTVKLDSRGEFGISASRSSQLEVSASRGTAEIDDGTQRVIVRAGELVTLAGPGSRAQYRAFNSAQWDSFAAWANERANGSATSVSASRLPYELRVYGSTLDQYGRWEYLTPYGYVWYPAVGVAWRPYYDGSWARTRYGWTWYGRDRWAWPTHHYGRWGFNGFSWYWIPSAGWGPAWVSWGYSAGYVSWAPLGWNGLPAIGLWPRRDHPAYYPNYDPWRGWTVVRRDQFGPRRPVRPRAIDGRTLDEATRSTMIVQNVGPGETARAVPRGSLSIPANAGYVRRDAPRVDRPGVVRRPQDVTTSQPASSNPPTTNISPTPQRRVTDAPANATTSGVPSGGVRTTPGSPDQDEVRRGRVRAAEPAQRPAESERPIVTVPGRSSDDDGSRDANRAVPHGGVIDYTRRGGSSTQEAGGSDGRAGGYAVRGGGEQQGSRGGSGDSGGAQPRTYGGGGDRGGAQPRTYGGGGTNAGSGSGSGSGSGGGASDGGRAGSVRSGGRPAGGSGAGAGSGSGAGSGGGAVRRPR
jgi:uncharacterized protein DUF6600/FecR-like protein